VSRKLKDSVVVVTGASSGIGRATALEFARKGASVVAAARRSQPLEELAAQSKSLKGSIVAVPTDVGDQASVNELAGRPIELFGRIDVWVNNAAVTAFGRVDEVPLEDFQETWETNVMGYVHGVRAVLPAMRQRRNGVIINVASIVGRVGQPYATAYTMTKHAVRALSIGLRQELQVGKVKGVDVCTIMPASIDTPLFQHGANYTGWKAKPMSPVYPPEKVAKAIVKCAHDPKPEVFVGGAARMMQVQSMIAPRLAERALARQVDSDHFDKKTKAPRTSGNVHSPVPFGTDVTGGWGGRKGANLRRALLASAALGILVAKKRA
jgi:NAD(P)-dependent dehydrogenase (short-subunit alcohol dehydrogenase family)